MGEVCISGSNVTPGYESNPDANAKNFFEADGKRWFRTGDQGAFDEDGFLHLTGRLKEIINRGGEKVSPLEVDGVLMDHPAIAQAVTFALPHPKLGRGSRRSGCPVRRTRGRRARIRDLCRAHGRLRSATQSGDHGRNPQRRDRQDAAHRHGRETRPG